MRRFSSRQRGGSLVVAAVLLVALPALVSEATMMSPLVPPTVSVSVDGFSGPKWEYSPALDALEMASGQGRGHKLGLAKAFKNILGNRADVEIKQLEFDPDPFVLNNVLITNTTGSTQIYTVGIALPTVFPGPNIISGNVRTDVIDGGGAAGGTVATVPGNPIYSAQIDFGTVATLQNHPFSVVAPTGGSSSLAASFGPMGNAVPVTSNIGIQLRFSLTAGDTASLLSRFDVLAIPEPTTFGLGAVVLVVVAIARSRRLG